MAGLTVEEPGRTIKVIRMCEPRLHYPKTRQSNHVFVSFVDILCNYTYYTSLLCVCSWNSSIFRIQKFICVESFPFLPPKILPF